MQENKEYNTFTEEKPVDTFEQEMLKKVNTDFSDAKNFLQPFHNAMIEHYQRYHNYSQYKDLRAKNTFPFPFSQQQEDKAIQHFMDKLYYKDRPCTLSGTEETDKADADVKQDFFDWLDYKDKARKKVEKLLRDCFRYRYCVAQVEYKKKTKKKLVGIKEPLMVLDEMGNFVPILDPQTQKPIIESRVELKEEVSFNGATIKRIDPLDFFFTQNKSDMDDGEPVMVRSMRPKTYFDKDYFINQDQLKEVKSGGEEDDLKHNKRMVRDYQPDHSANKNNYTYIEWHGLVDKKALYDYLGYPQTATDENGIEQPVCAPGEMTMCLCGVVDDKVIVRLEEYPFMLDQPNIVVGFLQSDEDELGGVAIADKISAVSKGLDVLMGILLENFKQSVNAQHIINKNALITGADVVVNKAGGVLLTNDNPNNVHKRIDQPRVAPDIYGLIEFFTQMGQDSSSVQDILGGKGEAGLETLGESQMVLTQAANGLNDYLKSFEDTLVEPLWSMRNQINMQYLDQPYLYGVLGEKAIEWRTIEPGAIRANVDFICESSSRETNRMVITQQTLQFAKIAPQLQAMGIPFRFDVLLGKLAQNGFSWSKEEVYEVLPTLKMEDQGGMDINNMLLQNMMMQNAMGMLSGGGNMPAPTNAQDLNQSYQKSNTTQIGSV